ncbi:MAG: hypothetical protein Q8P13_03770 [bacterium]|nr:hypothetical protein [bacterium]
MKKRSAIPQYTYRQSSKAEEKIIYQRIALVCAATLVILLIIYFWGLSFINVLSLLGGSGSTSTTESKTNNQFVVPLHKPEFNPLQSPTNTQKIDVTGTTTPDAQLSISINGKELGETQTADKSGYFKFSSVSLRDGINQIKVTATDSSATVESASINVVLDTTAPNLSIGKPANNESFDEGTKTVTVSGTTSDPDGLVYINSIQAILNPKTGNFSYKLAVTTGQNQIEIKASDAAGNSVTQKRTITVQSSTSTPTGYYEP